MHGIGIGRETRRRLPYLIRQVSHPRDNPRQPDLYCRIMQPAREWRVRDADTGMGGRRTIHGQFAAQAAATPDAVAVVCRGRCLTYAEVGRRARALACRLRRAGVGPEAVVAVLADRSLGLPAALLGRLTGAGPHLS